MRAAVFTSAVICVSVSVGLFMAGNSEFLKIACLLSATAWGVSISRLYGWKSHWKTAGAAALVTAVVFAILGAASVFSADWQSTAHQRTGFALYIGAMSAIFFGAIGGASGLVCIIVLRTAMKAKNHVTAHSAKIALSKITPPRN